MKQSLRLIISLATISCFCCAEASDVQPDWTNLFNGRDLSGWQAVPPDSHSDWSVQHGKIEGKGSKNRLSYLAWHENDLADFELTLRYRIHGQGNTGIEIRAAPDPSGKRPFVGYHADLGHVGIGPHILGAWDFHFADRHEPACPRGMRLTFEDDGSFHTEPLEVRLPLSAIESDGWNRVRVRALGDHFQFFINGKLSSEFWDHALSERLVRGTIALQIHDAGTRVEFNDIRLRKLKPERKAEKEK